MIQAPKAIPDPDNLLLRAIEKYDVEQFEIEKR